LIELTTNATSAEGQHHHLSGKGMRNLLVSLLAVCVTMALVVAADAQVKIIKVDDRTVYVDVGADRAIQEGMKADVYRQAEPVIHPVTGENLGSPRVKIARLEVTKVGPTFSACGVLEQFAPVRSGDLVEGLEIAPTAEDMLKADIEDTRSEIRSLTRSLAEEIKANQRSIGDLRKTLTRIGSSEKRLQNLINSVRNIRERMVVMDGRIGDLETKQAAIIERDTAEVKPLTMADLHELRVLRRGDEEAVFLTVGDKVYRLSFEKNVLEEVPDSLLAKSSPARADGGGTPDASGEAGDEDLWTEDTDEEEAEPFYLKYWWIAPIVGVLGAVVLFLMKMMGRGKSTDEEEDAAAEGESGGDDDFIDTGELDELEGLPEEIPEPEEAETVEEPE